MDTAMAARVNEYLDVAAYIQKNGFNAEVVAAIVEQIGKDQRCEMLMANGHANGNGGNGVDDVPATKKQVEFMKDLGITVPANVTKLEASRLIDEAQAKKA